MIVLAVLLLVLVAALVVFVVITGTGQAVDLQWEALNIAWSPSALVVFLLGALALLLVAVAVVLLRRGTRRKVEQRRELKRLREVERHQAAAAPAHDTRHHDEHAADHTDARHESVRAESADHPTTAPTTPPAEQGDRGTWHDDPNRR